MATIAQWSIGRLFAAAEKYFSVLFSFVDFWSNAAPLVAAIAKWLLFTFTAGAPSIFLSRLNLYSIGCFLGNNWLTHKNLLWFSTMLHMFWHPFKIAKAKKISTIYPSLSTNSSDI